MVDEFPMGNHSLTDIINQKQLHNLLLLSKHFLLFYSPILYKHCLSCIIAKEVPKLKADQPHTHDYLTDWQTPLTDNYSSLLFAALNKAEPLIYRPLCTRNLTLTFDLDLWSLAWLLMLTLSFDLNLKQGNSDVKWRFLALDLDLWATTLIYNPNLPKVKVSLHTKYQGPRSNRSAVRVEMDGQTDRHYQVHNLPTLLWIISGSTLDMYDFFLTQHIPYTLKQSTFSF